MSQDDNAAVENGIVEYLKMRVSRAQLLKATAAGLAVAAVPGVAGATTTTPPAASGTGTAPPGTMSFPFFPQIPSGTYTTENITDIINIAQTAEYLATTLVNAAVTNASTLGISGVVLQVLQAALAEEVAHVQFLAAMGATPMTTTFTVPDPKILTDYATFFRNAEILETLCNAAYMTATREFAELGQPTLAKLAYQAGSVEGEHRVMARAALALKGLADGIPPDNKAFETDHFLYMRDAAAALMGLGFIGGTGTALTFPGVTTALGNAGAMAAAVIQKVPNNAVVSSTPATDFRAERGSTPTSPAGK